MRATKVSNRQWTLLRFGGLLMVFLGLCNLSLQAAHAITGPSLVWSRSISGHIVLSSPTAVDLNNDGTKDIVVGALDGKVYGFNGTNGADVSGWPVTTEKPVNSSAAVADVDGSGKPELFIGSGIATSTCAGGGVYSFNTNGTQRFHFLAYDQVSNGGSAPCNDLAVQGSPALGDVSSSNDANLTFGPLGVNTFMINSSGGLGYGWPFHWDDTQFASPALGDITNDGKVDIVMGGDASVGGQVNFRGGLVRAIDGFGHELWEFRTNEQIYSAPVIGDVNGDGEPEIVFGTGNFYANNGGASDSTKVFCLDRFGRLLWVRDLGAQTLASPTLADLNGDGRLDVVEGTWSGPNAGKIFALNGQNGNDMPGYPINSGGNLVIGQVVTADLEGGGWQDIIANTGGGVYAYSGKTGALLFTIKNFGSFQNSAWVGDLDGNGKLDIVIAGSPDNQTGIVERYEMPSTTATLGTLGWPKWRKDDQQTGSWLSVPLQNPNADVPRTQLTSDHTVQVNDILESPNGQSALTIGPDGNLGLYRNFNKLLWSTNTSGSVTKQLIMQTDGNLVLYNSNNAPIWSSGTGGNPGAKLVAQDDGNLVIYSSGNAPLWWSGTSVPNWQSYTNDTMYGGNMLMIQGLTSADGRYRLVNQKDGNVVLYSPSNRAIWQSGTSGKPEARLALQSDGNLVVYGVDNAPLWWTGTNQRDKLILQNDGNLVVYNGLNQPLWNSGTGGQL